MHEEIPAPPYGIIGLGLIGGSLARALRNAHGAIEIIAVDPDAATRENALKQDVVSKVTDEPTDELLRASVVFLCVSVGDLESLLPSLHNKLAPGAVLTDVAGVKTRVQELVSIHLATTAFVGGHPMAGGERGGFRRSRANLFGGTRVALCPGHGGAEAVQAVEAIWKSVGADPVVLSASAHDRIVAQSSHLPYVAAVAQARLLTGQDLQGLTGRGLKDATRHAGFNPDVMAKTVQENAFLPELVRRLAKELEGLAETLESPDSTWLAAAEIAEQWRKSRRR